MYENIRYEVKENIAYITVARPKAMNALNMDVLNELSDAFNDVEKSREIRAVILTGDGKAFVAGADIAQMNSLNPLEGREMMSTGHKLMNLIENLHVPVIAAVNGFALGGGCELAMACDIRIASEKAVFGQPEVGLGIIPGFGGTQRLARLVGKGMAKMMILSGTNIKADEAYRIGLVQKLTAPEDLIPEAEKLASVIASKAPIAVACAKSAINNGTDMDLKSASQFEIETFTAAFGSEDKTEGMTAFLEKRPAVFSNK